MGNDFIPGDVEEFIRKRIDSVAQLEALLLIRSDPEAEWSVEVLARRLYTSEKQTLESVERLHSDSLIICKSGHPPSYQYQPSSSELRELIDRVAEAYAKHLVPITNLIHSKPKTSRELKRPTAMTHPQAKTGIRLVTANLLILLCCTDGFL